MSRFAEAPSGNQNKDVLALLTMLSNPEDLRVKLEEMTRREKELDERIALAGEADQVVIMRKNCEIMQAEAVAEVEKAKVRANEIIAQAEMQAKMTLEGATLRIDEDKELWENHRLTQEAILEEKRAALAEAERISNRNALNREDELKQRSTDLDNLELRLHNAQQDLNARQKDLEVREARLLAKINENESLLNELMEWQTDLQRLCASWQNDLNGVARER